MEVLMIFSPDNVQAIDNFCEVLRERIDQIQFSLGHFTSYQLLRSSCDSNIFNIKFYMVFHHSCGEEYGDYAVEISPYFLSVIANRKFENNNDYKIWCLLNDRHALMNILEQFKDISLTISQNVSREKALRIAASYDRVYRGKEEKVITEYIIPRDFQNSIAPATLSMLDLYLYRREAVEQFYPRFFMFENHKTGEVERNSVISEALDRYIIRR